MKKILIIALILLGFMNGTKAATALSGTAPFVGQKWSDTSYAIGLRASEEVIVRTITTKKLTCKGTSATIHSVLPGDTFSKVTDQKEFKEYFLKEEKDTLQLPDPLRDLRISEFDSMALLNSMVLRRTHKEPDGFNPLFVPVFDQYFGFESGKITRTPRILAFGEVVTLHFFMIVVLSLFLWVISRVLANKQKTETCVLFVAMSFYYYIVTGPLGHIELRSIWAWLNLPNLITLCIGAYLIYHKRKEEKVKK